MIAYRVKQKLNIVIDYKPNNYIDNEDFELTIFLNGKKIHTRSNLLLAKKDLTFSEIMQEAKIITKMELGIK